MVVEGFSFGEIVVNGRSYRDDVVLTCGEAKKWVRGESHQVELEDITDLIPADVTFVVFGTGFNGRMVVSPKINKLLRSKGIACIEQKTPQAIETYENLLEKGSKAVAFLHLGC